MSFFAENPIWQDVEPIPMPENDNSCARIAYDEDFAVAMSYFRRILKDDEKSERALALTERVISGNAANYTAWYFRRECLAALGSDLKKEVEYVTYRALESPKNYQIWYHRRAIVDKLGEGSRELDFIAEVLAEDSKNYHAWSYRQWVLERFNLWEGELAYVGSLIDDDLRNNSAWNQRWFVVSKTTGFETPEKRTQELQYAFRYAKEAPNNESPYNYIKGIMRLSAFNELDQVQQFAVGLLESLKVAYEGDDEAHINASNPPPLLGLLVEVYSRLNDIEKVTELCTSLGTRYDTIRAKYWKYRLDKLSQSSATPPTPPVS